MMNDLNRTTALELAEDAARADHFDSEAIVHALVYVGDAIERQTAMLAGLGQNPEERDTPLLRKTLTAPSPFQPEQPGDDPGAAVEDGDAESSVNGVVMPNERPYRPATNPEDWRMEPGTGLFVSPAGRRFDPRSMQAQNVMRKLAKKNLALKMYDPNEPRPIKPS